MYSKNGLLYSMLDAKGNKVGVPIKASALNTKPTLKNLETDFQRGSLLKHNEKERLTHIIDTFFRETNRYSRASFCGYMHSEGINAVFRENKEGRVYGMTLIDNKSGAVFNGSDLGKGYSGQALVKQLANSLVDKKQKQGHLLYVADLQVPAKTDDTQSNWPQDLSNSLFNLMKAEKSSDPLDPNLNRKRKRKKGLSR